MLKCNSAILIFRYWHFSTGQNGHTKDLKGRYSNLILAEGDHPPIPTHSFTNLALIKNTCEEKKSQLCLDTIQGSVDDIIERKETVEYKDLLDDLNSKSKILLLEGRPGCGKTTLTRKICKDWGTGAILNFVKYLFLIPLRQFHTTPIIGLSSILQYFFMTDLEEEITKNQGQEVCFLFDGLDEYSQKYKKNGLSWFEQLLRGYILPSSKIIITSRPHATVELRQSVNIRGEVLGFFKDQIEKCINDSYSTNPSKACEVKAFLHSHQNIQHMCYVPLHLAMIIYILNNTNEKDNELLPNTETNVYELFTRMGLVRYYTKKDEYFELPDLRSLPSPESAIFLSICKLAYEAAVNNKTSVPLLSEFSDSDIPKVERLGITVVDRKVGIAGAQPILSFAHLTYQEFLAAYNISTLPLDEQLKVIRTYMHVGQNHMDVVLKFFCGITGLQNTDHWTAIMDNALLDSLTGKKVNLKALHCIFESQNGQRSRELFSNAGGELVIKHETLTLLDYCVVGYCLESACDTVTKITLQCQLTGEGLEIIAQKLTECLKSVKELE